MKTENLRIKKDNGNIRILRNRVGERENEIRRLQNEKNFFESQVTTMKHENRNLHQRLQISDKNLSSLVNQSKGQLLVRTDNGAPEYVTKKEWHLGEHVKELELDLLSLQKEKDRYEQTSFYL